MNFFSFKTITSFLLKIQDFPEAFDKVILYGIARAIYYVLIQTHFYNYYEATFIHFII